MIKKTGLVIAATASSILLSGCLGGACNAPEPTCCEPPCVDPCNSCKCVSQCKQTVPHKKHKKHHYRAENAQAKMDVQEKMNA
jgi:hypothetical protein